MQRGRQPPPQAGCVPRWLTFPPWDLHLYTIRQKDAKPAHVLASNNTMHARTSANRTGKAIINPARAPPTHCKVFPILLLGSQVHQVCAIIFTCSKAALL